MIGKMGQPITVSELNAYLKERINTDENLRMLCVEGEVSNLTIHTSGHIYFTLKDKKSSIKAILFRGYRASMKFIPADGMQVLAVGDVALYDKTGAVQLYVQNLYQSGLGEIYYRFEQLKAKLTEEGLFDPAHKKPIPKYPEAIGVITSPTGAAVQDILNVLARRYPLANVRLRPVHVQGLNAVPEILAALQELDAPGACDTILLARGGGSLEDLYVFNDERIARAIYAARTPIVTGIGHETDYTIADFAADLRAPTPSAAAELAVPDKNEVMLSLLQAGDKLQLYVSDRVESYQKTLLADKSVLLNGMRVLLAKTSGKHSVLQTQMHALMQAHLQHAKTAVLEKATALQAANPLRIYEKGYAKIFAAEKPVVSVTQVSVGQTIDLALQDGRLQAEVKKKEGKTNEI